MIKQLKKFFLAIIKYSVITFFAICIFGLLANSFESQFSYYKGYQKEKYEKKKLDYWQHKNIRLLDKAAVYQQLYGYVPTELEKQKRDAYVEVTMAYNSWQVSNEKLEELRKKKK